MNKHIVAIGGGEIRQLKTLSIDKAIVALTNKKHPRLLFIPTASNDSEKFSAGSGLCPEPFCLIAPLFPTGI